MLNGQNTYLFRRNFQRLISVYTFLFGSDGKVGELGYICLRFSGAYSVTYSVKKKEKKGATFDTLLM